MPRGRTALPGGAWWRATRSRIRPVAQRENDEQRLELDPVRQCYLPGVPRATYMPFPFQIIQTEGHVIILYEYVARPTSHLHQRDPAPGRRPVLDGRFARPLGGRHVGGRRDQFQRAHRLDGAGNFHSDALHVVERYTRLGTDYLQYEATIEDPQVFTRPWTMRMLLYRRKEPNVQLLDYQCYAFDHDDKGLSVPLFRSGTIR